MRIIKLRSWLFTPMGLLIYQCQLHHQGCYVELTDMVLESEVKGQGHQVSDIKCPYKAWQGTLISLQCPVTPGNVIALWHDHLCVWLPCTGRYVLYLYFHSDHRCKQWLQWYVINPIEFLGKVHRSKVIGRILIYMWFQLIGRIVWKSNIVHDDIVSPDEFHGHTLIKC